MSLSTNKHLSTILNIVFGLFIFIYLFVISFLNTENVFNFNFDDIYTKIYFGYFIFGIIGLIILKFFHIKNKILREETLYTIKSIFFISVLMIASFFITHKFLLLNEGESNLFLRAYGKVAFVYFALSLVISPILTYVSNQRLRDNLILLRKSLGILAFIFTLKHAFEYFAIDYIYNIKYYSDVSYFEYVYKNLLVRYDALSGVIAGFLMIILGLTSNKISVKLFGGKKWKMIQSLVYPAFLLISLHIAFASRFDNFYTVFVAFVIIIRLIPFIFNKGEKKTGPTTKYICIPCGYIYDENIGDPDSGLEPGTKFKDIPDDWYCPVCGVTKSDFEPYYEDSTVLFGGYFSEIVGYKMLTDNVLELSLKVEEKLEVIKGQYAILVLRDFDGEFSRAYSIVEYKNNILKFGIKLNDTGRGGRQLKKLKVGDNVNIKGIYGEFVLKDTSNPKVFISTGTGLSPMVNMVSDDLKSVNNFLFFGVQKEKDLFYIEEITNLKNTKTHIYLSREEKKGFNYGRIDLSKFDFDENTEFYICGNPKMVDDNIKYLEKAGFSNIYAEKF